MTVTYGLAAFLNPRLITKRHKLGSLFVRIKLNPSCPFLEVSYGAKPERERVHVDHLDALREKCGSANMLVSAESYLSPVAYGKTDTMWCAPFFVFRAKEGDGDREKGIGLALDDVRRLLAFLADRFAIDRGGLLIFYDCDAGFHVQLDQALFLKSSPEDHDGIDPSPDTLDIVERIASFFNEMLELNTLDLSVYKPPALLRLADTIDPATNLFCIELQEQDLKTLTPAQIVELAKSPTNATQATEPKELNPNDELRAFYRSFEGELSRFKEIYELSPKKPITKSDSHPACIKNILETNSAIEITAIYEIGTSLALYYKDTGSSCTQAIRDVCAWTETHLPPEESTNIDIIQAKVRSIIKKVYSDPTYHFVCALVREIRLEKGQPVACNRVKCSTAKEEDQEVAVPPQIELDKALHPALVGKKVGMEATITGGSTEPFLAPSRVKLKCRPTKSKECEFCPLAAAGGTLERDVPSHASVILELIKTTKGSQTKAIRGHFHELMKCDKVVITVLDHYSIYEVSLMPIIKLELEIFSKDRPFVSPKAIYVGSDGTKLIGNSREWTLTALLMPNPKDQAAILQIVEAKELEGFISAFKVTPEINDCLKVFEPAPGESAAQKYEHIVSDLTQNVTKIYGREEMLIAMDVAFHSATSFFFDGDFMPKGWIDILIVGDTGQGKSHMANRLIQNFGLGVLVDGESASRTGLVYSLNKEGDRWRLEWGIIPLSDRKIVVIDEFSGLSQEDREKLTAVRSSGIVEPTRVIRGAKAMARTRLIMMCNPPDGRPVAEHSFGVDIVGGHKGVFEKPEDVRRLDFALVVAKDEVPDSLFTRKQVSTVEHKYLSHYCKLLLLWVWSRKPDQIEFDRPATNAVYHAVEYLIGRYSPQIPLCEKADLKNKVARISVAFAGRLHSTDSRGEMVIVKKDHVEMTVQYLDRIYSKPSMGYREKSVALFKVQRETVDNEKKIQDYLKKIFKDDPKELVSFCTATLQSPTFTQKEMAENASDMDKDSYIAFFKVLRTTHMVKRRGHLWVADPSFTNILRAILRTANIGERQPGEEESEFIQPADGDDGSESKDIPDWLRDEPQDQPEAKDDDPETESW